MPHLKNIDKSPFSVMSTMQSLYGKYHSILSLLILNKLKLIFWTYVGLSDTKFIYYFHWQHFSLDFSNLFLAFKLLTMIKLQAEIFILVSYPTFLSSAFNIFIIHKDFNQMNFSAFTTFHYCQQIFIRLFLFRFLDKILSQQIKTATKSVPPKQATPVNMSTKNGVMYILNFLRLSSVHSNKFISTAARQDQLWKYCNFKSVL